MAQPGWLTVLEQLPELTNKEKARARVLILQKPAEDRDAYVAGTHEQAVAAVQALLEQDLRRHPEGLSPLVKAGIVGIISVTMMAVSTVRLSASVIDGINFAKEYVARHDPTFKGTVRTVGGATR